MKWFSSVLILAFSLSASALSDFQRENLYMKFQGSFATGKIFSDLLVDTETKPVYVDALWDLLDHGSPEAKAGLRDVNGINFSSVEKLKMAILKLRHLGETPDSSVIELVTNQLRAPEPDARLVALVATYASDLENAGASALVSEAQMNPGFGTYANSYGPRELPSAQVISDIFHNSPIPKTLSGGKYKNGLKLFMFCRKNRNYPCLMALKNSRGETVRNDDGTIWTHPALASSALGLPSSVRNGHTPTGIMRIDGVMPTTDNKFGYGEFRRLILNFIPNSQDERIFKGLLPQSSHLEDWWKASVTARDVGRTDLRIHGTGETSYSLGRPWYPYIKTAGCVAQLEGTYAGVNYQHQRELLDMLMKTSGLERRYENETRLKGLFYILDIDDRTRKVSPEDLREIGIL